jgi:hypothetical protein
MLFIDLQTSIIAKGLSCYIYILLSIYLIIYLSIYRFIYLSIDFVRAINIYKTLLDKYCLIREVISNSGGIVVLIDRELSCFDGVIKVLECEEKLYVSIRGAIYLFIYQSIYLYIHKIYLSYTNYSYLLN